MQAKLVKQLTLTGDCGDCGAKRQNTINQNCIEAFLLISIYRLIGTCEII